MTRNLTTDEVIHLCLERSGKLSKVVADEVGINYNTFMRKVSPTDEGTGLFVKELIPFMNATGCYSVLDHLNERCGRMYVPAPRGIRKGTDPKQDINKYSSKFMKMAGMLMRFVDDPNEDTRRELLELMRVHQGDTENMRRRVQKHNLHQTELF